MKCPKKDLVAGEKLLLINIIKFCLWLVCGRQSRPEFQLGRGRPN